MKANFDLPQVRSLITRPPLPSHFVMARRVIRMPRIVCTGYEVTGALRRYLEVGLGLNIGGNLFINVDDDDDDDEDDDDDDEDEDYKEDRRMDEKALAAQREAQTVRSCQKYFSVVRRKAPPEAIKVLEIPYCEISDVLCWG